MKAVDPCVWAPDHSLFYQSFAKSSEAFDPLPKHFGDCPRAMRTRPQIRHSAQVVLLTRGQPVEANAEETSIQGNGGLEAGHSQRPLGEPGSALQLSMHAFPTPAGSRG